MKKDNIQLPTSSNKDISENNQVADERGKLNQEKGRLCFLSNESSSAEKQVQVSSVGSNITKEIELFREEFRKCGWKNKSLFTLLNEEKINERMLARYLDLLGMEKGITETKEKIIKAIKDLDCEDYTLEVEERDKQIIKLIEEKI